MTDPTRLRPVTILRAWLRSCGIPSRRLDDDPCADLAVQRSSADRHKGDLLVVLSGTKPPATQSKAPLLVAAADVTAEVWLAPTRRKTGLQPGPAMKAFWQITTAAGWGQPTPVNRGVSKRVNAEEDPELVAMRHKEFRRSPNPDRSLFLQLEILMERMVQRRLRRKGLGDFFKRRALDPDDIMQYGRIWIVNYLGHSLRGEGEITVEDHRLCSAYVKQKLGEMAGQRRRFPNDASGQVESEVGDESALRRYVDGIDWPPAGEELEQEEEFYSSNDERRQLLLRAREEELARMPHDQLVTKLSELVISPHVDEEVRRIAKQRLSRHQRRCFEEWDKLPHDQRTYRACSAPEQRTKTRSRAREPSTTAEIPQANSLLEVRLYVGRIFTSRSFDDRSKSKKHARRHELYYRAAATTLRLVQGEPLQLTPFGQQTLETDERSQQERQQLLRAILAAPALALFRSLFEDPTPKPALAWTQAIQRAGLGPSTAARRASTLRAWHAYVHAPVKAQLRLDIDLRPRTASGQPLP